MRGVVCLLIWLLAASLPAWGETAVEAQNRVFKEGAITSFAAMTCPKKVDDELNKILASRPELAEDLSKQALLDIFRDVGQSQVLASSMKALEMAGPEQRKMFMERYAAAMGISVDELQRRMHPGVAERKTAPAFMSRTSARIAIDNLVPSFCDSHCETDLAWNIMLDVVLWRAMCFQCSDDFLSVIDIGSRHWVSARILTWLRAPGPKTPAQFPLEHLPPDLAANIRATSAQLAARDWSKPGSGKTPKASPAEQWSRAGYELIEDTDPALATLCGPTLNQGARPVALAEVQASLCSSPGAPVDASTMRLTLTPGDTSCGGAEDYIACAKANNSVELTFKNTRYSFFDLYGNKAISVGPADAPSFSGQAILYHEIGHWFGLPHVASENYNPSVIPDVMQDTYLDNGCLTMLSMSLMGKLDETRYAQRLNLGAGLRRPRPSR